MRHPQRVAALVVVLLAALSVAFAAPASAAEVQISLTAGGPNPPSATARSGDTLVFTNNDLVDHVLKAKSSNWTLNHTVAAGAPAYNVKLPTSAAQATYTYTDSHVVGVGTQINDGTVTAAAPAASPTPSRSPSARPSASASRPAAPAGTPSASASPGATPTSSTGVAIGPGIGVGVLPTTLPSVPGGPQPNIAPAVPAEPSVGPSATATAAPLNASGAAGNRFAQGSGHRYGLPTALAVVALAGIASLLVRLLLAHPAAVHRAPDRP